MPMLNLATLFTAAEIADAINVIPNKYSRLGQLGIFPGRGAITRTVLIEEANGILTILPTTALGPNVGSVGKENKRKIRPFVIPQIIHEDHIDAKDVEAVRMFGGDELMNVSDLVNQRLGQCRDKHEITHEWHRAGALRGTLLDADGSTVIYNWFTEFGITQKVVDFALGTADTDVRKKCMEVKRHIEKNLKGDTMTRVRAIASATWMDKFTSHANVQKAFLNWQAAADNIAGDVRTSFKFGDITFEEYVGAAPGTGGTDIDFIPDGDVRFYPEGTRQTFDTLWAPADFNESVNKLGQVYYAKIQEDKWQRGYDIHTQSNPLTICKRPAVLVRGYSSN